MRGRVVHPQSRVGVRHSQHIAATTKPNPIARSERNEYHKFAPVNLPVALDNEV